MNLLALGNRPLPPDQNMPCVCPDFFFMPEEPPVSISALRWGMLSETHWGGQNWLGQIGFLFPHTAGLVTMVNGGALTMPLPLLNKSNKSTFTLCPIDHLGIHPPVRSGYFSSLSLYGYSDVTKFNGKVLILRPFTGIQSYISSSIKAGPAILALRSLIFHFRNLPPTKQALHSGNGIFIPGPIC